MKLEEEIHCKTQGRWVMRTWAPRASELSGEASQGEETRQTSPRALNPQKSLRRDAARLGPRGCKVDKMDAAVA